MHRTLFLAWPTLVRTRIPIARHRAFHFPLFVTSSCFDEEDNPFTVRCLGQLVDFHFLLYFFSLYRF